MDSNSKHDNKLGMHEEGSVQRQQSREAKLDSNADTDNTLNVHQVSNSQRQQSEKVQLDSDLELGQRPNVRQKFNSHWQQSAKAKPNIVLTEDGIPVRKIYLTKIFKDVSYHTID